MAGHARERRPGVWELRAYLGRDPLTGRKRYETETVHARMTQHEADKLANAFAVKFAVEPLDSADLTFGALLDRWFKVAGPRMVPSGQKETLGIINGRLQALRDIPVDRLGARTGTAILDEFYAALRERGGVCRRRARCAEVPCRHGETCTLPGRCETYPCDHGGGAPLADGTVIRTDAVVHAALEQAVKWGLITRNAAGYAYAGESDADEVDPPEPADVVRLFELAAAMSEELVTFLVVASTTGQRRGAVGALQWEDVDLENGSVTFGHVLSIGSNGVERVKRGNRRSNRKGKGRKPIGLDPTVVAVLLAHRARCEATAALAGAGPIPPSGYVFSADPVGGTPWYPGTVTRWFAKLRREAGIDETRLHDLRHFVVTYLLVNGVDLATVKGLVGHSLASKTTETIYAHSVDESAREATGLLARLLNLPAPMPAPDPDDPRPDAQIIAFRPRVSQAAADA